jgi:hypothetical protein
MAALGYCVLDGTIPGLVTKDDSCGSGLCVALAVTKEGDVDTSQNRASVLSCALMSPKVLSIEGGSCTLQHSGLSFVEPLGRRTLQSVPGGQNGGGPPSPAKAGRANIAKQAIATVL